MRIGTLFLLFTSILLQGQGLEKQTMALANAEAVRDGRFTFYAVDLDTGLPIIAHDTHRRMSPASTMKVLTNYAVLDILGPDHRFVTKVGYTGSIDEKGTLHGNLIIEADGDPALDSEEFQKEYGSGAPFDRQIIRALKDEGIKHISGQIIIDESCYMGIDVPDEWTWQDMGNYYGAGAHAFTFQENEYGIYFKSSSRSGEPTEILKTDVELQHQNLINHVKSASIRSDQAYCYSSPHSNLTTIHGEIPLGKSNFKIKAAMSDPAAEFLARLKKALAQSDIWYDENELYASLLKNEDGSYDVQEILEMESPRLIDLVAYTNLKSDNLYAEHFLRQIGRKKKGEGSFQKGAEAVAAWCAEKGISTKGLLIKDGSGLSRADLVTSQFMVDLLGSLRKEVYFDAFKNGLPIAGVNGSMRKIGAGTSIAGKMYAKTGYIEGVRAYAGYLEKGGHTIAFCIIANDFDLSPSQMRIELTRLMVGLGE